MDMRVVLVDLVSEEGKRHVGKRGGTCNREDEKDLIDDDDDDVKKGR